jgi:hypothetical protein
MVRIQICGVRSIDNKKPFRLKRKGHLVP